MISTNRINADQPCSEPFWDAVRYLCDELTEAEAAAFEERLAADPTAAEALAQAVLLTDSLAEACPVRQESVRQDAVQLVEAMQLGRGFDPYAATTGVRTTTVAERRWKLTAVAVAAVVLVALGWFGRGSRPGDVAGGMDQSLRRPSVSADRAASAHESTAIDSVLSAWVTLSTGLATEGEDFSRSEPAAIDSGSDDPMDLADPGVPNWMFAALMSAEFEASGPEGSLLDRNDWEDL